jgi:VanZ family protein
LNLKNFSRLLLLICVVAVLFLATTSTNIPAVSNSNDKLNHIFAFVVLTFLADMSTERQVAKRIKWITISVLFYGLLIEIVQWQLPYRSFSIADMGADLLGISLYWGAAFIAYPHLKRLQ